MAVDRSTSNCGSDAIKRRASAFLPPCPSIQLCILREACHLHCELLSLLDARI